jgi:thioredoxin reductase (NADPH)
MMPTLRTQTETGRYDLLIIGTGPAGVACALQAHRDGLAVLAVGDETIGGLLPAARRLDNLAAWPGVSGKDLAQRLADQMDKCGVPSSEGHVDHLSFDPGAEAFVAELGDGRQLWARTVCVATGTRPRTWALPNTARWLHRDARSLPLNLHDTSVAVIGGGEAALDTALTAHDRHARVHVLVRGGELRAVAGLIGEVEQAGILVWFGAELSRAEFESGWRLRCADGRDLEVDRLVICIGRDPCDDALCDLLPEGHASQVFQAERPGLYLAGDLIRGRDRYVATAMGDGQRAAVAAGEYLASGERK